MKTRVGLSYQPDLHELALRARDEGLIDVIEIQPERYIYSDAGRARLGELLTELALPYSFHFACSSIASADFQLDDEAWARIRAVEELEPVLCSDHLTSCRIGALDLEMNLPMIHTEGSLSVLVENLETLRPRLAAPFLLENIAAMWTLRRSTMDPNDYLAAAVEAADCGILLDLHNLYADELNHGLDAREALARLPLSRVAEVHVAGGSWHGGFYYDGHDHDVPAEVFGLLERLLAAAAPAVVILEREARFVELEGVWRDLVALRRACER